MQIQILFGNLDFATAGSLRRLNLKLQRRIRYFNFECSCWNNNKYFDKTVDAQVGPHLCTWRELALALKHVKDGKTISIVYHKEKNEDDKSCYPGWMTCDFTSFSTVFQSYQVNDLWLWKKRNHLYNWKDPCLKMVSNLGPLDQQGRASPTELPGLLLPQCSCANVRICTIFLTFKLENFCSHLLFVGICTRVIARATLGIFLVSGPCIGKDVILSTNREDLDQVMHLCSLICMFFICNNNISWKSTNWIGNELRLWECAGWTESLLFVYTTLRHLFLAGVCSCAKPREACFWFFGKDEETGVAK